MGWVYDALEASERFVRHGAAPLGFVICDGRVVRDDGERIDIDWDFWSRLVGMPDIPDAPEGQVVEPGAEASAGGVVFVDIADDASHNAGEDIVRVGVVQPARAGDRVDVAGVHVEKAFPAGLVGGILDALQHGQARRFVLPMWKIHGQTRWFSRFLQ